MQEHALPTLPSQANQHFMEALVDLSEHHEIEVSEDIYAHNGTKLLARGSRVDAKLYERVINHKLRRPIETTLVSSRAFSTKDLCSEAEKLLDEIPLLRSFCNWSMGRVTPLGMLERVKISPQAGTLLAVAESRNAKSRAHLALVALIAAGLAHSSRYKDPQMLGDIIAASVFHDIGEIYVDPDFFASSAEITPLQWQSFAAHPIIGAALVREVVGLDATCQTAILQHHERIDGIGYPRGVTGSAMSPAANVLAIAEVVSSMRGRGCPLHRIDIALKIVPHEFDPAIIRLAHDFLDEQWGRFEEPYDPASDTTTVDIQKIADRIEKALELRHEWHVMHPFSPSAQEAIDAAFERFMCVRRAFTSTGIDGLEELLPVLGGVELREVGMESSCVLDEVLWRLTRLSRDLALKCQSFSETERQEALRLSNILAGLPDRRLEV
ncbi:MAG: hypothetical protein H6R19_1221 [Proteobacteria bacterium]|nr:hypothetical protein [Pseudomonadota bacterium]